MGLGKPRNAGRYHNRRIGSVSSSIATSHIIFSFRRISAEVKLRLSVDVAAGNRFHSLDCWHAL